jgi:hypothetical protein
MLSNTYKRTLRRVKSRHSLNLVRYKGRPRAVDAKLSYYVFEVREAQDAAVQLHGREAVLIIQALPII